MPYCHFDEISESAGELIGRRLISAADYCEAISASLLRGRRFCAAALYRAAVRIPWKHPAAARAELAAVEPRLHEAFGPDIESGYWEAVAAADAEERRHGGDQ